jgi:hypothetical protein
MRKIFAFILAAAALLTAMATQARAGLMTFTVQQVGYDVVITAEGSFNLSGLSPVFSQAASKVSGYSGPPDISTLIRVGDPSVTSAYQVHWTSNLNFFAGQFEFINREANSSSGDRVGFLTGIESASKIWVTGDGQNLSGSSTFNFTTLADLNLYVGKSGLFTYADLNGNYGGAIYVHVIGPSGGAMPEPSSLLLVGSMMGLGLIRRRR